MKGFLFIPDMAVAVLRDVDPKTQTRRVIFRDAADNAAATSVETVTKGYTWFKRPKTKDSVGIRCDYKVGERRCLLTTWAVSKELDDILPTCLPFASIESRFETMLWHAGQGTPKPERAGKSRPGRVLPNSLRHLMPVFEVTAVRAERVQDITEADAIAEGCDPAKQAIGRDMFTASTRTESILSFPRARYIFLWNNINAKRGFGWEVNPWAWVISFRRVKL